MFKRCFAEFFGTMMLVLFACGVAAVTGCTGEANSAYLLTALAFGAVLCVLVYAVGGISGCHINPAVSFAFFLCGKLDGWSLLAYTVAQTFGGIAGAGVLRLLLGEASALGANGLYQGSVAQTLLAEGILTFFFVFTVLCVAQKKEFSRVTGLVLGFSLTLVHLFGIALTGAGVNPARSLGPALFVGGESLNFVWVFWAAPLIGAFAAALVYLAFYGERHTKKSAEPKTEKTLSEKK